MDPLLQIKGISKRFGGVTALDNIELSFRTHCIHGILGENGAGKSTLIKIIAGVLRPESGTILLDGREMSWASPVEALQNRIVCIFQELSLIPDLSVADNICIMNAPLRNRIFIDRRKQLRQAEELLASIGCEDIDPQEACANLSLSRRQMVEIAKALGRDPRILILDEATSALNAGDIEKIYAIVRKLRERGVALIYITHHLREAALLADECTVLRNGKCVETFQRNTKSEGEIISMMIGRTITKKFPEKPKGSPDLQKVLEIRQLGWHDFLSDINLDVRKGEIVGLGGLDGQGQREILLALFGVLRGLKGQVLLNGKPVTIASPATAKKLSTSIALIPEDRKTEGLILPLPIGHNITLSALDQICRSPLIRPQLEKQCIRDMVEKLQIKLASIYDNAGSLSGGNQQKVVIAKWLLLKSKCLLLMDPTRGIDVGTKQELYVLLRELANNGASILLFSTDHDELVGICDRVFVLYRGRIVARLQGADITEYNLLRASLNLLGKDVDDRNGPSDGEERE